MEVKITNWTDDDLINFYQHIKGAKTVIKKDAIKTIDVAHIYNLVLASWVFTWLGLSMDQISETKSDYPKEIICRFAAKIKVPKDLENAIIDMIYEVFEIDN